MPAAEKQVRVFISSTFRDMHAERDHLVTVVFPELRERVEQLGLEFFDVDLRWGVPAKDANGETANSWEYCRQWIDRVEPFFVCILGQRYGWVPEPEQLKAKEDSLRQQDERRSITDMEVRHAVLNTKLKRRSYFYLRATKAPETASEYVDPPPLLSKLAQLKNEVRSCGRPVRDYPCEWTGNGFAGMEEFGRCGLDDLWSGVLRDERYVSKEVWRQVLGKEPDTEPLYTDESRPIPRELWEKIVALAKPKPKEPLDAESEQMDAFAASRLRWFQGRTYELQQLTDFLHASATDAPRLAIIAAVPGQGKSALLAHLHQQLKSSPDFIITHFVGATEHSASAHALVERLLGELDRSGITWPTKQQEEGQEPKLDFNSLCFRLAQRLGDYVGERRIVVLLDALNQLSDGHDLQWLPTRLAPGVRLIVSCVEDGAAKADSPEQRILHALASRQPAQLRVPLGPLTEADVRKIVVAYLKEYCHELDSEHLDTMCAITQARNPLYLLVMLNELRTLGGNDLNRIVPARITSMPQDHPDTVSLFRWVLRRLEVFGPEAVRWWCLYLAHGRVGMASHELADLLARKLVADAAATALRIERGLRRYLQRRGQQLDFFHGQLRQAVFQHYGRQADIAIVHSDIATYFHEQENFFESLQDQRARACRLPPTPRPANLRKVEELVYQRLHLLHATQTATSEFDKVCEELEDLLTDLCFLEAKTEACLVFELARDFSEVVAALPQTRPRRQILRLLEEAVRRDIHFVNRHPTTLFQNLWNLCWWYDSPNAAKHYDVSADRSPEARPWNCFESDRLSKLVSCWRRAKEERTPDFPWIQANRPPITALASGLITNLSGQSSAVNCVGFDASGNLIASASDDGFLRLWESNTDSELSSTAAHSGWAVASLAWAPRGGRLASAGDDGSIRIWDAPNMTEVFTFTPCEDKYVDCLNWFPDGNRIAACVGDGSVRVWNVQTGVELLCIRENDEEFIRLAISPDGRRVATGSSDYKVRIWDAGSGESLTCLREHSFAVTCMTFDPLGRYLVSASKDSWIIFWDAETGREHGHITYPGDVDEDIILSAAFDSQGRFLATGSRDRTVRLWSVETFAELGCLRGHEDIVTSVAFEPSGRRLISASHDGSVRIWDVELILDSPKLVAPKCSITDLQFDPSGRILKSDDLSMSVRFWDLKGGGEIGLFPGQRVSPQLTEFDPTGSRVAAVFPTHRLGSARFSEGDFQDLSPLLVRLITQSDAVSEFLWNRFPSDAKKMLSDRNTPERTRRSYLARAFNLTLAGLREPMYEPARFARVKLSADTQGVLEKNPQGAEVFVLNRLLLEDAFPSEIARSNCSREIQDRDIEIWDVERRTGIARLQGHTTRVSCVAWSPCGTRIASSGSWDLTVRIWNAQLFTQQKCLRGHKEDVDGVAWSPQGHQVASWSSDDTVRMWDSHTGEERLCLKGHSGGITSVAWSPDSSRIASAARDKTVRVWDAHTGAELACLRGHEDWVNDVGWSPDGSRLASLSRDLRVWDGKTLTCSDIIKRGHWNRYRAIITGAETRSSRVERRYFETAFQLAGSKIDFGWYPSGLDFVLMHPSENLYAGSLFEQLHLIRLAGNTKDEVSGCKGFQ